MPSDPTVKRTSDLPDDRSLCFASKPYRQRHDLLRAGGTVRNSPRSSGILPSVAPSFPPGPAVPSSTRERETQGPPWSKLAASRQSPVRASAGISLPESKWTGPGHWPCFTPDATAPCQTAQDKKPTKNPHLAGSSDGYGLLWSACWCREGESNPHDVSIGGF